MYPQSEVTDSTLISTLNTTAGTLPIAGSNQSWTDYGYYISGAVSSYMWHIDLANEGIQYRGVYFTSYRPYFSSNSSLTTYSYQDDNGYTTSSVYWFKYEPITWRILDIQDEKVFLMADLVLDAQDYYYSNTSRTISGATIYANNYEHSHIRSWLNDSFYNTSFTSEEKALIRTSTVDNSVASTGYATNQYACKDTNDKVFLLSYVEATSAAYGFNTAASRQLQASAYSLSQGAYADSITRSFWWLRSPCNGLTSFARRVGPDGDIYNSNVNNTNHGVVAVLWISL